MPLARVGDSRQRGDHAGDGEEEGGVQHPEKERGLEACLTPLARKARDDREELAEDDGARDSCTEADFLMAGRRIHEDLPWAPKSMFYDVSVRIQALECAFSRDAVLAESLPSPRTETAHLMPPAGGGVAEDDR